MSPFQLLSDFLYGAVGNDVLISLAIIFATIIFEDPTTMLVGMLAADGLVPVPVALGSIYVGIVLGDTFLYGVGYAASSHPRFARFVHHKTILPFRSWLEKRYVITLFSVRFLPGLRIPVYVASGFFRNSLPTFVATAICATMAWSTLLFFAAYLFGQYTTAWFEWVRYGITALVIVGFFMIGRHNLRSYTAHTDSEQP